MFKKIKKIKQKVENNKPLMITYRIFKWIFGLFLCLILFVILVQKFSNNNLSIGGVRIFSVATGSMKPEYQIGDIIVTKKVPVEELKVGDNVTYLGKKLDMAGLIVTHKIMNIRQADGKYYFITKGTANEIADPEINYSQIYGKVTYHTVVLSFIGRVMTNIIAYYAMFTVVGVLASYQIVKIIFEKDEDELEEQKDGKKE